MPPVLLDTDILSEILKKRNSVVAKKAAAYLQVHAQFTFSAFTLFEVERGYKERRATMQLASFGRFCAHSIVLAVTEPILHRAADLWADARRGGRAHGDADVVIAATALEHGLILATGNTIHFNWIPGLQLDDWRVP